MYVDDSGMIKGLPVNERASGITARAPLRALLHHHVLPLGRIQRLRRRCTLAGHERGLAAAADGGWAPVHHPRRRVRGANGRQRRRISPA